jgi:hypothetical protein
MLLGFISLAGLSCSSSDKLNPVKGKVVFKGEPLAGALVSFHPKGGTDVKTMATTGLTKEDGTFTVVTGQKEGAPAGEYVVTIICTAVAKPDPSKKVSKVISTGEIETIDVLGGAYANKANSKLTATIKSGNNELEPFDLK